MAVLLSLFFYMIPVGILALFIVSLCMLCSCKRKQCAIPGSVPPGRITTFQVLTIISGVLSGILLSIVILVVASFSRSAAFM